MTPIHRWMAAAALAALLPLAGCSRPQVAVVNGEPITQEEFQSILYTQPSARQLLSGMVESKLLVREAEAQGVPVTEEQLNQRLEQFKTESGPGGLPYEQLRDNGLSDSWVKEWVLAPDEAVRNLAIRQYGSKIKPEDVRKYYENNKQFLERKERFKVRIATFTEENKARQAEAVLNKGGSFEAAADQSGMPANTLVVERGQPGFPEELMSVITSTPVGKTTSAIPIRSQGGPPTSPTSTLWAIAVVDAKLPAVKLRLEDPVVNRMLQTQLIFQTHVPEGPQSYRSKILEQARQRGTVVIVPQALKAVESARPGPEGLPGTPMVP